MQVPVIHMLINFLHKHQNPNFLSQIQFTSSLFKWGALILALLAAFRTLFKSRSIYITKFRQNAPSLASIPLLTDDDDYTDTEDDKNDDDGTSSTASFSSSGFEDNENDVAAAGTEGEFFRFRGSLRCRSFGDIFSLSEIANSKSVVKLWDTLGLGLGFGFSDDDESVVSVYEEEERMRPVATGKQPTAAVSSASPAVLVSAGENASGNLAVRIWDNRLRRRIPAVIAEWGKTVGDDGRYRLTVGDLRNVRSPLENVTESHVDTWWPNSFQLKI